MRINAEFDRAVAIDTETMDWVASPMPGVDRRMLDRIGEEVARATSIVRYAPGSHFSEHTHSGGEEFIVLEGTFQDDYGDFPAGSYVRNPIGTKHVPRSDDGCTIFVKLWQFEDDDQKQFSVDMDQVELAPVEGAPGLSRATLHEVEYETVLLETLEPGSRRDFAGLGGAEVLVLDGAVEWEQQDFDRHSWLRFPAGSDHAVTAGSEGARLWIKTGHLNSVTAPAA